MWVGLYTKDPAVFSAGAAYLRFVGSVYAFQGIGLSIYFASQGAGKVIWPVAGAFVRVFVAVGGAAVAVVYLGYGITSLFLLVAAGMLVFGCFNAFSLWLGAWGRVQ